MKVIVYGSRGWIGRQFTEILEEKNITYLSSKVRAEDYNSLLKEIESYDPTHIVSFIGRTHGENFTTIDYLEQKGKLKENIRDNLFGPLNLAMIAERKKIHYTYLGTGCIFSYLQNNFGREVNGFEEISEPNFFGSSYSIVKGFTDTIMKNFENCVLNLRIRMPITDSRNERNFITKITSYEKICSIPNSMSVLPELLPIALDMMEKGYVGTFNLTNPGLISHNEILEMYRDIVDSDFCWQNFSLSEQSKVLLSDRSNNFLDTKKLTSIYNVTHIKEAVRRCLINYKDSMMTDILVTGGCGFIGSNFINKYDWNGKFKNLINVDAMYYCSNEKNIDLKIRTSKNYILKKINLRDSQKIREIFDQYNISHIVHFAAQSHVDNSFNDSIAYTYDNILGTHNLLEECKFYGKIERFVHVSTDEVYGGIDKDEMKNETNILCPTNPYSATKAGAEMLVHSYKYSFDLPVIITRGNNVYGPNQYKEKVIPKFIDLLKNNKKITLHGDGSYLRDYMHVNDAVDAFTTVLEKGEIGEIYNLGCDENKHSISVLELAKLLIKKIKNTENYTDWIEYIEDRPFNDIRYFICNNKLKKLGWTQKINLEEGLNKLL